MGLLKAIESKLESLGEKWEDIHRINISEISLGEASCFESKTFTVDEFIKYIESGKKFAFYMYGKKWIIYKPANLGAESDPNFLFHIPLR
ncbi:MAG: hypothetical protein AAB736_02635 [Patescibacteria group bacterium]